MADESQTATLETRKDAGTGAAGVYKLWMRALELAGKEEKGWRKDVDEAVKRYREEEKSKEAGSDFNMLYAQTETLQTAIYNSQPIPDVRHRFGDDNPIGKLGSDIVERALITNLDSYDFDAVMRSAAFDDALKGRAVTRVNLFNDMTQPEVREDGTEVPAQIAYQRVECSTVHYDDFRRGPGRCWADVPWVAFREKMTRDELVEKFGELGRKIELDWSEEDKDEDNADNLPKDSFKRAIVWQIWDKPKRQVVYIAPSHDKGPLKTEPDPLSLRDFFPMPRPMYDLMDSDNLVPVVPYNLWKDQAKELDSITRRIAKLVKAVRYVGVYGGAFIEVDLLKDAEDGDLVPAESMAGAVAQGGLDRSIWFYPIEVVIQVIRELQVQREQIKQVIFELTGISDIMRGQSEPGETLGAQRIKAQWGSLRLQRRQADMQRYARDMLRLVAELMVEHFEPQVLQMMTGIQAAPEDWMAALEMLKNDASRHFSIDIETDSTIQADAAHAQEQMTAFVQGSGAYFQAVGAAVESGAMPMDVAVDIYVAFCRKFNLGRQAEDALDRLGRMAREKAQQPEQPKPDPEMAKVQGELQLKQQDQQAKLQAQQADMQMKAQGAQADAQMRAQEAQAKLQADQQRLAAEMQLKREEMLGRLQIEREKMLAMIQLEREKADAEIALRRAVASSQDEMARDKTDAAIEAQKAKGNGSAKPA